MTKRRHKLSNRTIRRQSLPEALAESLRERILDGEFREGDALVQEAIAEEYAVSRMPVREALRQLEASGLVALRTHKGAVVTSLPLEQIGELFDLRALLEGEILGRAIPEMTEASLAASAAILEQLEAAYESRDVGAWGRLNWAFHRSLYAAAGRTQTLTVVENINLQTDRYIRLQLLLTGGLGSAEQEHRELLQLCAAQKAEQAVLFLERHILKARDDLLGALEKSRATSAA